MSTHVRASSDVAEFVAWLSRRLTRELGRRITSADIIEEAVSEHFPVELKEWAKE